MNCECDYEQPEFFSVRFVKAKKQHKCCECKREIQPGELYEYAAGKWDSTVLDFHTCEKCADLREALDEVGYCSSYRDLFEAYAEYLSDIHWQKEADSWEISKRIREKHRKSK